MENKAKSPWLDDRLDAAKSEAERQAILKEWGEQKLEYARQREEAWLNGPSLFDKIKSLFRGNQR